MNTCPKCGKRILTDEEARTLTVNLKMICFCRRDVLPSESEAQKDA